MPSPFPWGHVIREWSLKKTQIEKKKTKKNNEVIGLLRKLQNILPKPALTTIYKDFLRPHLVR